MKALVGVIAAFAILAAPCLAQTQPDIEFHTYDLGDGDALYVSQRALDAAYAAMCGHEGAIQCDELARYDWNLAVDGNRIHIEFLHSAYRLGNAPDQWRVLSAFSCRSTMEGWDCIS